MDDPVIAGLPEPFLIVSWVVAVSVMLEAIAALLVAEVSRFELATVSEWQVFGDAALVRVVDSVPRQAKFECGCLMG